jgi:hypothetical protein
MTNPAMRVAPRNPLVPLSPWAIAQPLPASEPLSSEATSAFAALGLPALGVAVPSGPASPRIGGGEVHVFVATSHTLGAVHSESFAQPRQLFVAVSHTGVAPEQSAFATHATH